MIDNASPVTAADSSRVSFDKNLQIFREMAPHIGERLIDHVPETSVIMEDGRVTDIDLGGKRFYDLDVAEFTERQITQYFADPVRVLLGDATGVGLASPVSVLMLNKLGETMKAHGVSQLNAAPVDFPGVLVILGIGLGLHIRTLIERTKAEFVIIAEPNLDFIYHTLQTVDWVELYEWCNSEGIRLIFLDEKTPESLVYRLNRLFRAKDTPFLDGAYIYKHYNSWQFKVAGEQLQSVVRNYFISSGYYEDELVMLRHGVANFLRSSSHVIVDQHRFIRKEPVFIVGSGPSLDKSIEVIKKYQGHALIFSCGTALGPLLAAGIRPDFQCELENGRPTLAVLAETKRRNNDSFAGIRLIASSTVYPDIPAMFDEVFFFMRDGVSSTKIFGQGYKAIPGVAPTCTNTAFAAATALGFNNIYLFGVDCGVRNEKVHHSKNAFYYTNEDARRLVKPTFGITQRGNFGGTVRTNWVLDLTRMMLEGLQASRRVNFFNCSDGAHIARSVPLLPRSLKLLGEPLDKPGILAELREQSVAIKAGELFQGQRIQQALKNFDEFYNRAVVFFDSLGSDLKDCFALRDAVVDFLNEMDKEYDGICTVLDASARSLPKIGMFFIARVGDEKLREILMESFRLEYTKIFFEMARGTRQALEELVQESMQYEAARS